MSFLSALQELRGTELSELEVDNIGVWPVALRSIILLVVGGLLVFAVYYFHIREMDAELKRVQGEEATLKQTFETKAFQAANLDAYRTQMLEVEELFGSLLAQLPGDTEVPGLLEDITEIGLGSSLNTESIVLQPERAAEFYIELPIKIEATGGYHDFASFVSGVASLPRIVTMHDYTIMADKGGSIQKLLIEARTYRYKAQGE